MESETFRFISLIEKHPQLYNKKHKDFLRQDIRNTIWDNICKEMNWDGMCCVYIFYHDAQFNSRHSPYFSILYVFINSYFFYTDTNKAKKKWRNLRDKFVKKRRRHGGSSANEDESQREFYNSLMFLDGHVNSRK